MDDFTDLITDGLYNSVYKLEYLKEKYGNYSRSSKQAIINVFKKIGEEEVRQNKDVSLFTQHELQSLFEVNKWVSVGTIESKKTIIREYMRWYKNRQFEGFENCETYLTIDRINYDNLASDSVYELEWFTSIEELQSDIDVLYDAYEGVDDHELDVNVVCMYLAYYDVDSDEVTKIMKNHVSMVADQIYLPITERFIDLDPKPMQFIRDFAESEGYLTTYKSNIVFRGYKNTSYLLRSTRQESLSINNIRRNLSALSDLYSMSGKTKKFKYDRIQRSGVYTRLIEYEKQNGNLTVKDVDVFEKYFRASYRQSLNDMGKFYQRFKDYQVYREYYFK